MRLSVYGDAACRVSTSKSNSKQSDSADSKDSLRCTRDGKPVAQPRAAAVHTSVVTLDVYRESEVYGDAACRVSTSKSNSKQSDSADSRGRLRSMFTLELSKMIGIPRCSRDENQSHSRGRLRSIFTLGTLEDDRDPSLHSGLKTQRVTSVLTCSLLNGRSATLPSAGPICQISRAYSAMVRSLEKIPTRATFRMAFLAQRAACW